jgi:hypothetical protein
MEFADENALRQELEHGLLSAEPSEEMATLGDYRLAGNEWRCHAAEEITCPGMVTLTIIQQGNNRPCIGQ